MYIPIAVYRIFATGSAGSCTSWIGGQPRPENICAGIPGRVGILAAWEGRSYARDRLSARAGRNCARIKPQWVKHNCMRSMDG